MRQSAIVKRRIEVCEKKLEQELAAIEKGGLMTFTFKVVKIEDYAIEIEQEKYSTSFKVTLSKKISGTELYRTVNTNYYPTIEKAKARFSKLKSDVKNGKY